MLQPGIMSSLEHGESVLTALSPSVSVTGHLFPGPSIYLGFEGVSVSLYRLEGSPCGLAPVHVKELLESLSHSFLVGVPVLVASPSHEGLFTEMGTGRGWGLTVFTCRSIPGRKRSFCFKIDNVFIHYDYLECVVLALLLLIG